MHKRTAEDWQNNEIRKLKMKNRQLENRVEQLRNALVELYLKTQAR